MPTTVCRLICAFTLCIGGFELALAQMTPSQSAAIANAIGSSANGQFSSNINASNAQAFIPSYGATPGQANLFQNGNGNFQSPSYDKMASCAGMATAECVAIQMMQGKSQTANPVAINALDPLIVNASSIASNPLGGQLGSMASLFVSPQAPAYCPPGSVVTGSSSIEKCDVSTAMGDSKCQQPWNLQVQPWWTYECTRTTGSTSSSNCTKDLAVSVNWSQSCTEGTVLATTMWGWGTLVSKKSGICGFISINCKRWTEYSNGGYVRANCAFAADSSTVWIEFFRASASTSSTIPTTGGKAVAVPTTVTADWYESNSGITVKAGSGCTASTCNYNFYSNAGNVSFSLNFARPVKSPTVTESVTNHCNSLEANTTCSLLGSECLDGPSTKNINGLDVTRSCWKERNDYQCSTSGALANTCSRLMDEPQCAQLQTSCVEYSHTGLCLSWGASYKCTKDMAGTGLSAQANGVDTIKDDLDTTQCLPLANNPDCRPVSSVCTDSAPRTLYGFTFNKPCWNFEQTYSCPLTAGTSTCRSLIDKGCKVLDERTVCVSTTPSGACDVKEYQYECASGFLASASGGICNAQPYCINGVCYDVSNVADADFGKTVAQMEMGRQAATYMDQGSFRLFAGTADKCTRKLLANCCKNSGGAAAQNGMFFQAFNFGRQYAGSMYTYDVLFSSSAPEFLVTGLESLGVVSSVGANTFSAYGVTLGWGSSGFELVAFDPTSFAISIAVNFILNELMSCDSSDLTTGAKNGQGLCHSMGTYCSAKLLGFCYERKESYCCFNSHIAKALNVGGKAQLGISMGDAKNPGCEGLTVEQIAQVDASRIDLTEFMAHITSDPLKAEQVKANLVNSLSHRVPCATQSGQTDTAMAGAVNCVQPVATQPSIETTASSAQAPPVSPSLPDPELSATFNPVEIVWGKTSYLNLAAANITTGSYICTGVVNVSGRMSNGSVAVPVGTLVGLEGSATCTLSATNGVVSDTAQATLIVTKPKPSLTVNATPNPVAANKNITFSYNTTDTTDLKYLCQGALSASGAATPGKGSFVLQAGPNIGTANCTLSATGNGFTTQQQLNLTVSAAIPSVSFSASPSVMTRGAVTSISWAVSNAVSQSYECTGGLVYAGLIPASGDLASSGSVSLATTTASVGLTTCTLKALSSTGNGAQKTIQINVN